ncbi:UDP-N-acetylmuramate dehydrogenase [Alkaliphilus crotonatoxidans]
MDKYKLQELFTEFMPQDSVRIDEPMKKHTSFKIGGPADLLLLPRGEEDLVKILKIIKDQDAPFFVMGNGSNLLVKDKGLRQVVIKIADNYKEIKIEGTTIVAQAGILLSTLAKKALAADLGGLEFASGIPGTLGGAVAMNAGAYGGEMKDVVKGCRVLDQEGNLLYLPKDQLELGYRTSIIQKNHYIALSVELDLYQGHYEEIKERMDQLTIQRTTKQPLHLPSAGSVFKRPPGYFAGKLVEDCGLKGTQIGGAQVSTLHSGFIVNVGNATAADVLALIELIQKEVKSRFDVTLETEVKIIGEA